MVFLGSGEPYSDLVGGVLLDVFLTIWSSATMAAVIQITALGVAPVQH